MIKIILTRHGHVEGIDPPRFRGRAELPLTELGVKQAQETAKAIRTRWSPVVLYTSPLGRCVETGGQIARACSCAFEELEDLIDLDCGELQGMLHDDAKWDFPDVVRTWYSAPQFVRFPGGESLQDVGARTANALRAVLARNADSTVVLVGHDTVNRVLLLQLLGLSFASYWRLSQSPCGINEIHFDETDVRIECLNDTAHLKPG
jgi:probable phosphoglycerate mutase